jgi:uncharacterized protein (UPF0335 family)
MRNTLDYAAQKQFILEARFTVSEDRAARYLEKIERLAKDKTIAFSTKNRVRSELKDRGFAIPARQRSRRSR